MNRFFVESMADAAEKVTISDKEDVKHIKKVLRLASGDQIEVCNGKDEEYLVEICAFDDEGVVCRVIEKHKIQRESEVELTLFQSLPKGQKMELIVQKMTELGVKSIVPVVAKRSIVKIKDKKSGKQKIDRWQKIMDEAAKQSKRGILPVISEVINFDAIKDELSLYDLVLIPHVLEGRDSIKSVLGKNKDAKRVAVMIGPEGGFDPSEVEKALEWGAQPISLGPRILRTETAGIMCGSIVMYELGDVGGKQ